jgi:Xaa-Pro aminopeptidase
MHPAMTTLREHLATDGYDAMLVSHPSNRFYLSGFRAGDIPPDETSGFLLVTPARQFIITSFLNMDEATQEAPEFEPVKRERQIGVTVGALLKDLGLRRVAFEEEAMLVGWLRVIQENADAGVSLEPTQGYVSRLRVSKTEAEIAALTRALNVTDLAFEQVAPAIRAGMTERQVSWMLEEAMRQHGAQGPAFETIVAGGPNAARPHHRPTDRPLVEGEPIIIDVGAAVDGWMGDLTRTLVIGPPDARFREIYGVVLRAQEACLQQITAGMTGEAADAIARDIITAAGYGEAFGHSLGHGLGVRVHEAPNAAKQVTATLPVNSVLTIEPGIYLSDWGGVRIEDVGLITAAGVRNLTGAPKLDIAT